MRQCSAFLSHFSYSTLSGLFAIHFALCFYIFVLFCGWLCCWKCPKNNVEVLPSAPKYKKGVMCLSDKRCVLEKLPSGMSYSAPAHTSDVNNNIYEIRDLETETPKTRVYSYRLMKMWPKSLQNLACPSQSNGSGSLTQCSQGLNRTTVDDGNWLYFSTTALRHQNKPSSSLPRTLQASWMSLMVMMSSYTV